MNKDGEPQCKCVPDALISPAGESELLTREENTARAPAGSTRRQSAPSASTSSAPLFLSFSSSVRFNDSSVCRLLSTGSRSSSSPCALSSPPPPLPDLLNPNCVPRSHAFRLPPLDVHVRRRKARSAQRPRPRTTPSQTCLSERLRGRASVRASAALLLASLGLGGTGLTPVHLAGSPFSFSCPRSGAIPRLLSVCLSPSVVCT